MRSCLHRDAVPGGTCLIYKSAITVGGTRQRPRHWWASTAVKEQHRIAYTILQHFSLQAKSVWKEELDYANFTDLVDANNRGPRRQHRPLQAIALLTEAQLQGVEPRPPNFFSLSSLLDKFVDVDVAASSLGVCGA